MAKYNFEKEQREYISQKVSRLPRHWRDETIAKHADILKREGIAAANVWLRVLIEPLENLLNIAADDDDIKKLADDMAFRVREKASGAMLNDRAGFWHYVNEACLSYAVNFPSEHDEAAQIARLSDNYWWLRQLRVSHARAREVAAINAGLVHRKKCLYVSDDTLDRRGQQIKRNAALLESINMKSDSGQVMKLSEIAAAGVSNPVNRRNELMTRIKGFEDLSIKYGHKAEFITLTCPSRMHAVTSDGKSNPKYDGTKPHEAQRYLVEVWARVRAKFHRDGFKMYGLRVAEPHHDATPHWHVILFYKDSKINLPSGKRMQAKDYLRGVIRTCFMLDSLGEAGADKNRVKFVAINPLKGSAAGYVAKYVSKNIGGIEGEASDEGNTPSESAAARVEAWASTWRIRQFQQIGGHSVSVWRELRRIDGDKLPASGLGHLMQAWKAAQKTKEKNADFAAYVEAMGGLNTKPRESRYSLDDDYIMKMGRYGATAARVVHGVRERFGFIKLANNREGWQRV